MSSEEKANVLINYENSANLRKSVNRLIEQRKIVLQRVIFPVLLQEMWRMRTHEWLKH